MGLQIHELCLAVHTDTRDGAWVLRLCGKDLSTEPSLQPVYGIIADKGKTLKERGLAESKKCLQKDFFILANLF